MIRMIKEESEPLKADGFDNAIIGVDYKQGKLVYSVELILEQLMEGSDMTLEEAIEYFDFNIGNAYVGEMTPLFIWRRDEDDE
jgi:hypothetical protein